MPDWLQQGLIGSVVAIVLPLLLARLLPRRKLYMTVWTLTRKLAVSMGIRFGKENWEKCANGFIPTIYDVADAIRDGFRPLEKPEPTPPEG